MKLRPHALWALAFALAAQLHAATFHVNSPADSPDANPGDGLAQDAAGNTTLRAAIMESNALPGPHQILLDGVRYKIESPVLAPDDPEDRGDFNISGDITIIGLGESPIPWPYDHRGSIVDANGNNCFTVMIGARLHLKNLTVANATQPAGTPDPESECAGVLVNAGGEAWIEKCLMKGNNYAIRNEAATVHVLGCFLVDNSGRFGGAAIFNRHGSVDVADTKCESNGGDESSILPDYIPPAGSIFTTGDNAAMVFEGCSFRFHYYPSFGWGPAAVIVQAGGTVNLINTRFENNLGWVACYGGVMSFEGCYLAGSYFGSLGVPGGDWDPAPPLVRFISSESWGAIPVSQNAVLEFYDSIVYGYAQLSGNAVASSDYSAFISTTTSHGSSETGGTILCSPTDVFTIKNSIVTHDTGSTPVGLSIIGPVTSYGHNIITNSGGEAKFHAADLLDVDPMIEQGSGADHTVLFRLLPGSPAIDAADPSGGFPATDFYGVHRPHDGDGNGSVLPDIGAIEFLPTTTGRAAGDFDSSGCTDMVDFFIFLDNWQGSYDGQPMGLPEFLNLLDYWFTGPQCI